MNRVDADVLTWKAIHEYNFLKHTMKLWAKIAPPAELPRAVPAHTVNMISSHSLRRVGWCRWCGFSENCTLWLHTAAKMPSRNKHELPSNLQQLQNKSDPLACTQRSLYNSKMFATNPTWRFSNCNQIHAAKNLQSWYVYGIDWSLLLRTSRYLSSTAERSAPLQLHYLESRSPNNSLQSLNLTEKKLIF